MEAAKTNGVLVPLALGNEKIRQGYFNPLLAIVPEGVANLPASKGFGGKRYDHGNRKQMSHVSFIAPGVSLPDGFVFLEDPEYKDGRLMVMLQNIGDGVFWAPWAVDMTSAALGGGRLSSQPFILMRAPKVKGGDEYEWHGVFTGFGSRLLWPVTTLLQLCVAPFLSIDRKTKGLLYAVYAQPRIGTAEGSEQPRDSTFYDAAGERRLKLFEEGKKKQLQGRIKGVNLMDEVAGDEEALQRLKKQLSTPAMRDMESKVMATAGVVDAQPMDHELTFVPREDQRLHAYISDMGDLWGKTMGEVIALCKERTKKLEETKEKLKVAKKELKKTKKKLEVTKGLKVQELVKLRAESGGS